VRDGVSVAAAEGAGEEESSGRATVKGAEPRERRVGWREPKGDDTRAEVVALQERGARAVVRAAERAEASPIVGEE
jgi:hypothetical protein